jgi:hypothetical protein
MSKKGFISALDILGRGDSPASVKDEIKDKPIVKPEIKSPDNQGGKKNIKNKPLKPDLSEHENKDELLIEDSKENSLNQKINGSNADVNVDNEPVDVTINKKTKVKKDEVKLPVRPVIEIKDKKTYTDAHVKRTFYLSASIVSRLDEFSDTTGVPKSKLISDALDYYLNQVEIKRK